MAAPIYYTEVLQTSRRAHGPPAPVEHPDVRAARVLRRGRPGDPDRRAGAGQVRAAGLCAPRDRAQPHRGRRAEGQGRGVRRAPVGDPRRRRAGGVFRPRGAQIGAGGGRGAADVLPRCHLPAGLQGPHGGRAPSPARPGDRADRPPGPPGGDRHHGTAARRRGGAGRDGGRGASLHAARRRKTRLHHPDHPVGRRHARDRCRAAAAVSGHRRAAQGRHLLRHHQPPGGGQGDRGAVRRGDRGRRAQQLQFQAPGRGGRAGRLRQGLPGPARRRYRLVGAGRRGDPGPDRRGLGTGGAGRGDRRRLPRALRGHRRDGGDGHGERVVQDPARAARRGRGIGPVAVYTEVDDGELADFIAGYDAGQLLSFKGIAEGVENSNFLVHTTAGSFILTLYEKRVDPADLPFFLGLMRHLAAAGIPCPTPVETRQGATLGTLAGRPAALITFLEGMWIRRPRNRHCAELGAALAAMHLAAGDVAGSRPNALSHESWSGLFDQCRAHADEVHGGLAGEIDGELAALTAAWPAGLPTGVIHADLFPDNVFFLGDRLSGIIDFYFACTDALVYDLAICLNAWCFEPDGSFNTTKARMMLNAYRKLRAVSAGELAALPTLARGAALRFLLTRLYDWLHHPAGAFVKPKDPLEYLHKLRFHAGLKSAAAYGLD